MDKGDGSIKYILTGEGAGTTFTIDDNTGDIHAIQRLDREMKAQYVLRAQARNRLTDRPLEPESEFIVKIQDINDNEPRFLDGPYWATVPEMSQIGKNGEKQPLKRQTGLITAETSTSARSHYFLLYLPFMNHLFGFLSSK